MLVGSLFISSVIFAELLQLALDVDICPVFHHLQIIDAKGTSINYLFATYAHYAQDRFVLIFLVEALPLTCIQLQE